MKTTTTKETTSYEVSLELQRKGLYLAFPEYYFISMEDEAPDMKPFKVEAVEFERVDISTLVRCPAYTNEEIAKALGVFYRGTMDPNATAGALLDHLKERPYLLQEFNTNLQKVRP